MRSEYIKRCENVKTSHYSSEIEKCQNDQQKLYKFVRKITDGEKVVIYPECNSDEKLSENFSTYFIKEIDNIMNDIEKVTQSEGIELDNIYSADLPSAASMSRFRLLTQDDVKKL